VLAVLRENLWPAFTRDPMYENFLNKCVYNQHRAVGQSQDMTKTLSRSASAPERTLHVNMC